MDKQALLRKLMEQKMNLGAEVNGQEQFQPVLSRPTSDVQPTEVNMNPEAVQDAPIQGIGGENRGLSGQMSPEEDAVEAKKAALERLRAGPNQKLDFTRN